MENQTSRKNQKIKNQRSKNQKIKKILNQMTRLLHSMELVGMIFLTSRRIKPITLFWSAQVFWVCLHDLCYLTPHRLPLPYHNF